MATIGPRTWPCLTVALATACISPTNYEREALRRLHRPVANERTASQPAPPPALLDQVSSRPDARGGDIEDPGHAAEFDGRLASYVAYAASHHPRLRALRAEWRAAVHAVAETRRLPEPTVSYGVFVRPIETRVGPQRQRLGVRQTWPWPTRRRAATQAASSRAQADEERVRAELSELRRRVAEAYWQLWTAQQIRAIERRRRAQLAELADTVRTRITVDAASLAELTRLELDVSRCDDALATLSARIRALKARLRQAVGAPADTVIPNPVAAPELTRPDESIAVLRAAARNHPEVVHHRSLARASTDQERAETARIWPDISLALDYTQIGRARIDDLEDSGQDAWLVGVNLTVPLWRASYRSAGQRARAEAASHRAREQLAGQRQEAELELALIALREGARRAALYEQTLIPQAQTVYEASLGDYHTGRSPLADLFSSQTTLLDLQAQRIQALAEHAIAWARLESLVGRSVSAQPFERAAPLQNAGGKR